MALWIWIPEAAGKVLRRGTTTFAPSLILSCVSMDVLWERRAGLFDLWHLVGKQIVEMFRVGGNLVVSEADLAAEGQRGDADDATEDFGEVTLIGEAGGGCGAGQGHLRIAQELLGSFNSAPEDVLVRGHASACLE